MLEIMYLGSRGAKIWTYLTTINAILPLDTLLVERELEVGFLIGKKKGQGKVGLTWEGSWEPNIVIMGKGIMIWTWAGSKFSLWSR